MSHINVVRKFKSDSQLSEDEILKSIERALKDRFKKVIIKKENGLYNLTCRVKTSITNPLVKFKGTINIKDSDNKYMIEVDGPMKTSGWLWFEVVVFTVFGLLLLIWTNYRFGKQKEQTSEMIEQALDKVKNSLGSY